MNIINTSVQRLVQDFCKDYKNSKCDGDSFKKCLRCSIKINLKDLAKELLSAGVMFEPFRIGSIVYYVDVADIHRPIKEKIVSEYCFNEKVCLIILRDPISNLRRGYNIPCDCIFSDYEEARTYLIRKCKI